VWRNIYHTYLISSKKGEYIPEGAMEWRKYGTAPHDITYANIEAYLLEEVKKPDPEYNIGVTITRGTVQINDRISSLDIMLDSEFCLVLDLIKFQSISKKSEISDKRLKIKPVVLSDDQIRSKNLERYMSQLAEFKDKISFRDVERMASRLL